MRSNYPGGLLMTLASACVAVHAETSQPVWSQFRGPSGSAVAVAAKPPVKLGADCLVWKRPVPPGLSSPVLSRNRIFLTAIDGANLVTLAFDATNGKLAWRQQVPGGPLEKVHQANSPATPTPFAGGERVFVYFGSNGLLCYDHDGREQWRKPIPTPKSLYGMATSPIAQGNDAPSGLAAGVWTRDIRKAHQAAAALDTGTVWVNCYNASPWGGFKQSGWGREKGPYGLDLFTQVKSVIINFS